MIDFYPNLIKEGKHNHMEDSEWILTETAAQIMGIGLDQVQKLCRQYRDSNGEKGIKSRKLGRDWQVSREAAESYERKRKKKSEK